MAEIQEMIGEIFVSVQGATAGSERIEFQTEDGRRFCFFHEQDCCEAVAVEEIIGDIGDLLNTPIVSATETSNEEKHPTCHGLVQEWTFYDFRTHKSTVTIR